MILFEYIKQETDRAGMNLSDEEIKDLETSIKYYGDPEQFLQAILSAIKFGSHMEVTLEETVALLKELS